MQVTVGHVFEINKDFNQAFFIGTETNGIPDIFIIANPDSRVSRYEMEVGDNGALANYVNAHDENSLLLAFKFDNPETIRKLSNALSDAAEMMEEELEYGYDDDEDDEDEDEEEDDEDDENESQRDEYGRRI